MSVNPVNAWDARLLAVSESAWATTPTPANVAAFAAYALEHINCDLGLVEVGKTRPKQDRGLGRGSTMGFVEGRVDPIPWSVELDVKSRSAIDVAAREAVLYKAAGLKQTLNGSTNAQYTPSATPIESSDFASASMWRFLGSGSASYEAELLRGCVTESLRWEGGDKELTLKASGKGVGKLTAGGVDSVTFASGVDTTLTTTIEESYRIAAGMYYLCESEIIKVTTANPGSTTHTVARAQLGSTGAAHSTKPFLPYIPTGISYGGSPISEANATCTIGGITVRALSFYFDLTTGMGHLPGETGSKYAQGAKYVRYAARVGVKLVLSADQVSMLGKMTNRSTAGALSIVLTQGTGTGGIWSVTLPYCELEPIALPATPGEVCIIDVSARVRDNAGNDMFTITLT